MPNQMESRKEKLASLKKMDIKGVRYLAEAYLSGGGFGDLNKMPKKEMIKHLMSGKSSYFKGGLSIKKYVNPVNIVNNLKK